MKKLNKKELASVSGGGLTGTFINSLSKGITVILDLGRTLGSGIRRITSGNMCPF